MRKGIKYKACLILLSWLMIFAHNIIPHNHHEDNLIQLCRHIDDGKELAEKYQNRCDDAALCRISSLLYHQLSQDNLIIQIRKENYFCPDQQKGQTICNKKYFFYKSSYYTSASLRAPPAA